MVKFTNASNLESIWTIHGMNLEVHRSNLENIRFNLDNSANPPFQGIIEVSNSSLRQLNVSGGFDVKIEDLNIDGSTWEGDTFINITGCNLLVVNCTFKNFTDLLWKGPLLKAVNSEVTGKNLDFWSTTGTLFKMLGGSSLLLNQVTTQMSQKVGHLGSKIYLRNNSSAILKNFECTKTNETCIESWKNTSVLVQDSVFRENSPLYQVIRSTGVGLTLTIDNCIFVNNSNVGVVSSVNTNATVRVRNSHFQENLYDIHADYGAILLLENITFYREMHFEEYQRSLSVGASNRGSITIKNCYFKIRSGIIIKLSDYSNAVIQDTIFDTLNKESGTVVNAIGNVAVTLTNCSVEDAAKVIHAATNVSVNVQSTTIGNRAKRLAEDVGIYLYKSQLHISSTNIIGYNVPSVDSFVWAISSTVTMTLCRYQDNNAKNHFRLTDGTKLIVVLCVFANNTGSKTESEKALFNVTMSEFMVKRSILKQNWLRLVYAVDADVKLEEALLQSNVYSDWSGALIETTKSNVIVQHSGFMHNYVIQSYWFQLLSQNPPGNIVKIMNCMFFEEECMMYMSSRDIIVQNSTFSKSLSMTMDGSNLRIVESTFWNAMFYKL